MAERTPLGVFVVRNCPCNLSNFDEKYCVAIDCTRLDKTLWDEVGERIEKTLFGYKLPPQPIPHKITCSLAREKYDVEAVVERNPCSSTDLFITNGNVAYPSTNQWINRFEDLYVNVNKQVSTRVDYSSTEKRFVKTRDSKATVPQCLGILGSVTCLRAENCPYPSSIRVRPKKPVTLMVNLGGEGRYMNLDHLGIKGYDGGLIYVIRP